MNLVQFNQKEMKKAKVYMYEKMAGTLTEDENGFHIQYDPSYLRSKKAEPISLTLPLTNILFESKSMFPFFDGLNKIDSVLFYQFLMKKQFYSLNKNYKIS